LSATESLERLHSAIDKPLSDRRWRTVVHRRTVFGDVRGSHVQLELAGPYDGRTTPTGFAIWQPVFKGDVAVDGDGSMLSGRFSWHGAFFVASAFVAFWLISLIEGAILLFVRGHGGDAIRVGAFAIALGVVPAILLVRARRIGLEQRRAVMDDIGSLLEVTPETTRGRPSGSP
jgi:hypothetical protein